MAALSDLAHPAWQARINRAIDHVLAHLAEPLRLEEVAAVAGVSPFHFHRVFRVAMGETLHGFVTRVRLERALYLMARAPRQRLTDVALACGFASSAHFSRAFRERHGVPPSRFDLRRHRETHRADLATSALPPPLAPGQNPDGFVVRLRRLPARRVAYLRVFRPYAEGGVTTAAASLVAWARARGLAGGQWLGYQWDDPEIVPLDRCRYDVGVEVPEDVVLDPPVAEVRFAAMTVAELAIAGPIDLEMRALDWLFTTWLPRSGYLPDHQPCFEAWDGEPFAHGVAHFTLRLQVPVVEGALP